MSSSHSSPERGAAAIPFHHIAVYVPDGGSSDPALRRARDLAATTGARLTLLSALPVSSRSHTARVLSRFDTERLGLAADALGIDAEIDVLDGPPAEALRQAVLARGVDLLVKTARPRSLLDRIVGGVARSLLRQCPCPVWVVRSLERATKTPVVAMVGNVGWAAGDGERALARQVVELASKIGALDDRPLLVAHAFNPVAERIVARTGAGELHSYLIEEARHRESELRALLERAQLEGEIVLVRGDPATAVARLAAERDAQTIVVGNRGRTGLAGLIVGNTVERVIDETASSVLSVRAA